MRKAQRVWEIIKARLEINVLINGNWIVPKDKNLCVACPKFYHMSDDEFDALINKEVKKK